MKSGKDWWLKNLALLSTKIEKKIEVKPLKKIEVKPHTKKIQLQKIKIKNKKVVLFISCWSVVSNLLKHFFIYMTHRPI